MRGRGRKGKNSNVMEIFGWEGVVKVKRLSRISCDETILNPGGRSLRKMNLVKSLECLPFHVIPFPPYTPLDSRFPFTSASPPPALSLPLV